MPSIHQTLDSLVECSFQALLLTGVLIVLYAMLRVFHQICLEFGYMFVEMFKYCHAELRGNSEGIAESICGRLKSYSQAMEESP